MWKRYNVSASTVPCTIQPSISFSDHRAFPFARIQAQGYAEGVAPIIIDGKVTDGTNKLPDSEVAVFKGNELVSTLPTGKSGRFRAELQVGEVYSLEFRHAGFVPKRIVFDTHMPRPKKDHDFEMEPIPMDISLLEHTRFEGANMDKVRSLRHGQVQQDEHGL